MSPTFRSIAFAFVATLAFQGSPAQAAEEESKAMVLLDKLQSREAATSTALSTFELFLNKFKEQGMPDEAIKEIREAAVRFYTKLFQDPQMSREIAEVYEKHFSKEEIEQLTAFYESPIGKKYLKEKTGIMEETGKISADYTKRSYAEGLQKEVLAIVAKYKKPAEPAGKAAGE